MLDHALRPAQDQEVVNELAFVLQSWSGARGRRRKGEQMARMTAERLVDYLHLSGFELMRRPQVAIDMSYVGASKR